MKHIQWKPYVYKLTLTKGDETYFYIGSRSSKRSLVNPEELLNGSYNSSSKTVQKLLEEGWECKREILHTYEGTREGAMACSDKEGEILKRVKAAQSDQWLNESNAGASSYCHSKEHSIKQSEASRGRRHSEETKRRMSIAKQNMSEETKKKMSIAKQNMSEETKRKMSEAKKRYWAERKAKEAKKAQKSSENS